MTLFKVVLDVSLLTDLIVLVLVPLLVVPHIVVMGKFSDPNLVSLQILRTDAQINAKFNKDGNVQKKLDARKFVVMVLLLAARLVTMVKSKIYRL